MERARQRDHTGRQLATRALDARCHPRSGMPKGNGRVLSLVRVRNPLSELSEVSVADNTDNADNDSHTRAKGSEPPDTATGFEQFVRQSSGGMWDERDDPESAWPEVME